MVFHEVIEHTNYTTDHDWLGNVKIRRDYDYVSCLALKILLK